MTNTNINELTEGMKHNLSNIETNFSETIKKFESLPVLFKEIEKDSPNIIKKHLIFGFKDEMNKLYFELKKIQGSISLLSESFRDIIPNQHKFDIFNKTTGKSEEGLFSDTKENLKNIYEMTGDKIEVMREYDEFGKLIWTNPNPDLNRDISDDNMNDLNEFDAVLSDKTQISDLTVTKIKDNIKLWEENSKNRAERAEKIHKEFKKMYPKAFEPNCSYEEQKRMLEEFRQKRHQKEAKKLTKRNSKKVAKK